MRIRPCSHHCDDSAGDIDDAVRRLLGDCSVVEPPTPLADLLTHRRLSCELRDATIITRMAQRAKAAAKGFWQSVSGKILGILDLKSRHVLVNPHQHHHRQEFVAYHEIAHEALPWHHATFVVTSEADLSPSVRQVFNAEANSFAAKTIFQLDHMAQGYRGGRLQMSALAGVAAQYNASLTATARHYVSIQDRAVALIFGKPYRRNGMSGISFRYGIGNAAFLREFDPEVMGQGFPPGAPTCATVDVDGVDCFDDTLHVTDLRGEQRTFVVDTLYNGYETLTLVHPLPTRRTRKQSVAAVTSGLRRALARRRRD